MKIELKHAGLMAQYNNIFLEVIKNCPTEEEIEIVFTDHTYIIGSGFFINNHNISNSGIGDPNTFLETISPTAPIIEHAGTYNRVDIAEMNKLLSVKQIDESQRKIYNKIVDKFFNPNEELKKSVSDLLEKHKIDPSKILFTYFRGTDGAYFRCYEEYLR